MNGKILRPETRRIGGYPSMCRESCPALHAKRSHCRLAAWHPGEHINRWGAWDSGDRNVRPRARPPKPRT